MSDFSNDESLITNSSDQMSDDLFDMGNESVSDNSSEEELSDTFDFDEIPEDIDEEIAEDIDEEIAEDVDEEIAEDVDEEIAEDVDEEIAEDADEEIAEDADEEIAEDIDEEIAEDVDEEIAEDVDEEIAEDIDEEIAEDVDEEISEDIDEEIAEDADEEIAEDIDEEIAEDVDEEIAEDVDEEIAEDVGEEKQDDGPIQYEKVEFYSTLKERIDQTPRGDEDDKGELTGKWEGDRGESKYICYDTEVKEILDQHGLTGIEYKQGIPDFSGVANETVEIENMTENRYNNFKQADELAAKKWNKGLSGRDVKIWRENNNYSWHERNDLKTCDLIPTIINDKFTHLGGVSEAKKVHNKHSRR